LNRINLTESFPVNDFVQIKQKVLDWVQQFSTFCFLDNHQYQIQPHTQECLVAAGIRRKIQATAGSGLNDLQHFIDEKKAWLFGHLSYDLKNEIVNSISIHPDNVQFPDLFFFEPEMVIRFNESGIWIEAEDPKAVFQAIQKSETSDHVSKASAAAIQNRLARDEYISIIQQLQKHILRGDCYEINFCQEFYAENSIVDPLSVYLKMADISPNPFSALYRVDDKWLICASPERFLRKQGQQILSQPIKGTSRRSKENPASDEKSRNDLFESSKDRSENVMIVDLVRNDLSRLCTEGSVKVDELYGVYSFPQVHQMISTISGELRAGLSFSDMIRATFPMGSMTGAPKERVIQLIDQYEKSRRGIFSGTVGYITPGGDFDLNVVIRSIMYNAGTKYLSFQAGSAITFYSDPQQEWEECLLKVEAMREVLSQNDQ
jgi:para-aminobenzoate synthetase component 1